MALTCEIFLGTHEPAWLPRLRVPLFVSRRRLARRKSMPRAIGRWALDSGGFSELSLNGAWSTPATQYAAEVRRYQSEIGGLAWAAIQDWMCEPFMVQRTGLSVVEHQRRTVDNYAELLDLEPNLPWAPVLQGWEPGEYLEHLELYAARGFDLTKLPIVGIGSVCRRQHTFRAEQLIRELSALGLKLHGFGFKVQGLHRVWNALHSSDSLAWSYNARKNPPLPECRNQHSSCANCSKWALLWHDRITARVAELARQADAQGRLF